MQNVFIVGPALQILTNEEKKSAYYASMTEKASSEKGLEAYPKLSQTARVEIFATIVHN